VEADLQPAKDCLPKAAPEADVLVWIPPKMAPSHSRRG
jgi:hypothetical protein